jgi:hypothetical protein
MMLLLRECVAQDQQAVGSFAEESQSLHKGISIQRCYRRLVGLHTSPVDLEVILFHQALRIRGMCGHVEQSLKFHSCALAA